MFFSLLTPINQLIFDFTTHDYPGFDKFLGTSNTELVYVLQNRHGQFTYVWDEQGAGESHLLQAWVAQALGMGKNTVYIDAVTSPLTESVPEADYLAVDQIEKLDNEEQALLFAVFNRFRNSSGNFLLLSSGHMPQQLVIREDLRTRMAYYLVYEIKPLIDQEKIDALVSMAAARQVTINLEISEYLSNHWRHDMDSLMQMLGTLDNYAVTMGKRTTLPLLRQLPKQQETQ